MRASKLPAAVVALVLVLGAAFALAAGADSGSPRNGDFEAGNLKGWHTAIGGGGARGNSAGTPWDVYKAGQLSGKSSGRYAGRRGTPPQFTKVPQGKYAAAAYGSGGPRFLYRNLHLKSHREITLSMRVFYRNFAGDFYSPNTFDNSKSSVKNQQYRIDVIRKGSDIESLKHNDVLKNVFRTVPGDKAKRGPFNVTADLSKFAGKTVTLRLGETDNQFFFYPGVDAVRLTQTTKH